MSAKDLSLHSWNDLVVRLAAEPHPLVRALVPLAARLLGDAVVSNFFPFTSMNRLCLSRSSAYPWVSEQLPSFQALPQQGAFSVGISGGGIFDALAPRNMTIDRAVEFAGLGCGKLLPAFVGSAHTPDAARTLDETNGPSVVRGSRRATWGAGVLTIAEAGTQIGRCSFRDAHELNVLVAAWLDGESRERLESATETRWSWSVHRA